MNPVIVFQTSSHLFTCFALSGAKLGARISADDVILQLGGYCFNAEEESARFWSLSRSVVVKRATTVPGRASSLTAVAHFGRRFVAHFDHFRGLSGRQFGVPLSLAMMGST